MLTCSIDLESASDAKIKILGSTIMDQKRVMEGLKTLLSESHAEVEKLMFSVAKLRAAPLSFMLYTGLSFDDILYLLGDAVSTLAYNGTVGPDFPKKRTGNRSWGSRSASLRYPNFLTWILCITLTYKEMNIWS